MGRRAWIRVAVLAVALVAALGLVSAVAGADGHERGSTSAFAQEDGAAGEQECQGLELRLRIRPDGDVVWTSRCEEPLETGEDRAAFEDFAEEYETNETEYYLAWRDRAQRITESWSGGVDRSMAAESFRREAGVEPAPTRDVGYVQISWRWTNFAQVDGAEVQVGDVFPGPWHLPEGQALVFVAGGNLTFTDVTPSGATSAATLAESDTVSWTGEREFDPGQPRATLVDRDVAAAAADDDRGLLEPLLLGGGLALLVLTLLVVAFVRGDLPAVGPLGDDDGESSPTVAANGSAAHAAQASGAATAEPETTAESDAASLSDDDRVVALLEDEEGRMKQSEIVDETEWSKSKVSMLLSDMEEEGTISKIQVGRENIIALEGSEPEAAGSPFDDGE